MKTEAEIQRLKKLTTCGKRGRWLQQQAAIMWQAMEDKNDEIFNQTFEETMQQLKWKFKEAKQMALPLRTHLTKHSITQLKLFTQ